MTEVIFALERFFDACVMPHHRTILVNVSLDQSQGLEPLSWAVAVASRPGDSVIVLHLLKDPDSAGVRSIEKQYGRARTVVLSLLEQCRELCRFRQVTADARIIPALSGAVASVLVQQAAALGAKMLVLSSSDVLPDSKLSGFKESTALDPAPPDGCLVFVTEEEMKKKRSCSQEDESAQSLLLTDRVRTSFEDARVAEDYSPRGVLEGPNGCSPQTNTGSSSPAFSTKPLLGDPVEQTYNNNEDDNFQASCLSLFKHMKRHPTFPSSKPGFYRSRKLFPSFICTSSPRGMKFSNYNAQSAELSLRSICSLDKSPWRCFTYEELSVSTKCFHPDNLVGKGGYAVVYKGTLPDGQLIAVKKLSRGESEQHSEGGFLAELGIIGHVSHPNTIPLIGFCLEGGLHLVFPFSPNGSLSSVLHGSKSKVLEWPMRVKVAVGTARGLHYLHKLCPRRIIHRDIKASNILLGPDFEPQISDFGLAKWLPEQWTHHTVTPIEGTFGYLAPEYFMHGIVDEKTDVFAYGVLLLELISGRKPIDSLQRNIIAWARPYLESCNIQELVDPKLGNAYDNNQLRWLVLAATLCIRPSPLWRPCMNQVVKLVTGETLEHEVSSNWSTLLCNSSNGAEEYTSNEYHSDMNRHLALALES